MCNCSSIPANICNQCAQGNTCGCPPDYTVMPQPVACGCCPSGYSFTVSNAYPMGICVSTTGSSPSTTNPINCPQCAETISSDCVILPEVACIGLAAGASVTGFANFLCSDTYMLSFLQRIASSPLLKQAFCQIVAVCPIVGSTTPVLGPITVTLP